MNFRFGPANDPFTVALECSPRNKPSVRLKNLTQHWRLKWVDRSTEKNAWNLKVFVSKYWSDSFYFIAHLFNFNRFLQHNSFFLNNSILFHLSKKRLGDGVQKHGRLNWTRIYKIVPAAHPSQSIRLGKKLWYPLHANILIDDKNRLMKRWHRKAIWISSECDICIWHHVEWRVSSTPIPYWKSKQSNSFLFHSLHLCHDLFKLLLSNTNHFHAKD